MVVNTDEIDRKAGILSTTISKVKKIILTLIINT